MSRSATGPRGLVVGFVALCGLVAVSACASESGSGKGADGGDGPSSGGELAVAQADARMATYRASVREQTREAGRAIARATDGELKFAVGRYTLCTDDGAGWAYDAMGRVDPAAGADRPSHVPAADALEKIGYQVEKRPEPSGDIRLIADRGKVVIDRGKVVITVNGYADSPLLLFRVSSPCLIIPEEQREDYPKDEPSPDIVPDRM